MNPLLDPNYQRGNILPIVKDTRTGERSLGAPQFVVDLLSALMLPGDVYKGNVLLRDPETGQISDEVIKRSADLAGAVTLGAGAIPADKNSLRMGIKAYHGSPHDFDKFDLSKIGTGEGAQAYGHGLYFADNEAVAKQYRDQLTQMRVGAAKRQLDAVGGDLKAAKAAIQQRIDDLKALPNKGGDPERWARQMNLQEEKLAELNALEQMGSMSQGRMYEVNIDADPADFLDWDKPINEQSEKVTTALKALFREQYFAPDMFGRYKTGADAAPKGAFSTKIFTEAGIPGVKYLDAGSRTSVNTNDLRGTVSMWERAVQQKPTDDYARHMLATAKSQLAEAEKDAFRNYVVFDDKLISIVKKYGIGALVLAGVISQEQGDALAAEGYPQ